MFPRLFSPVRIGSVQVKNRIVWGPHRTNFHFYGANDPDDQFVEYVRTRAKGGCGMIIVGMFTVHPTGEQTAGPAPDHGILVPKLRKMADAAHAFDCKIVQQIAHHGIRRGKGVSLNPMWGFSERPSTADLEMTHEMTMEEVEQILEAFIRYAVDVQESGMDGIELHGTHGCLIQQSWSPWANWRKDKYGENLMTFSLELIDRVREAVGKDFVVGIRISADDWMPNGLNTEAMGQIAKTLEDTGKIDYFSFSEGATPRHYRYSIGGMDVPLAAWLPLHVQVKEKLEHTPTVSFCRINDPVLAEKILGDGQADLIGMVRALIADPDLPNKALEGRLDDIRTCIACNQGCIGRNFQNLDITCTQNALAGNEYRVTIAPASVPKKVVVVGGGPCGLEAARVAATRGHRVVLFEKEGKLGGQVNLINLVPGREEFTGLIRWLEGQTRKLGVTINLGVEATPDSILAEQPDAVIIATGSRPRLPEIPGRDTVAVFDLWQAILHKEKLGEKVLLIDHLANYETCFLAIVLLDQGKEVTIVTPYTQIGAKLDFFNQVAFLEKAYEKGLRFVINSTVAELAPNSAVVTNSYTNQQTTITGFDSVILAMEYQANFDLYHELQGKVSERYYAGDCAAHRTALEAIHEGFKIGNAI